MFSFLGKRWRFAFVKRTDLPRGTKAECDGPHLKGKAIRVRENLPEATELEALIHESLHACDWSKDEEWISQAASDISRFVYAQGWRRTR